LERRFFARANAGADFGDFFQQFFAIGSARQQEQGQA
jgi:hypothetical protein